MGAAPPSLPALRIPVADASLEANQAWQYYYAPDAGFARASSRHVRMHRIAWAVHLLRPLRRPGRGTLVDVGCGPGESTVLLAQALGPFGRVIGIEISLASAGLFRAFLDTYHSAASYVRATCTALPVRPGTVELITSFEMVEHVANWSEFIGEAAAALRPGGLLLLSTPNTTGLHTLLKLARRRITRWKAPPYRHYYDFYEVFIPDERLREAATGAGLQVEVLTHGGHVLSVAPDWTASVARAVETMLESRGWLSSLAVSSFLIARKP